MAENKVTNLERDWTSADIRALVVCAVAGLLLSALPHLLWWAKTGKPVWIADNDDLVSLAASANTYHNHPTYVGDILRESGGDSIYPALQYLPFVWVAKVIGLPPVLINLLWRLWAGAALGAILYLLLRGYLERVSLAAMATLTLLFNVGLLTAHFLDGQLRVLIPLLTGHGQAYFAFGPQISLHWRVLAPAAILPFVFVFLYFQRRARAAPSWGRVLVASVSFGSLFYLYFYFWLAAGLGLLLLVAIDAGHRRTHLLIGMIGCALGTPALVASYLVSHRNPSDWGPRNDFFLPIPHFSELLLPKFAILLLILAFIWIWRNKRDLLPLWALSTSGLMLANHQILTGLQVQNFHWSYVWGPTLSITAVLCLICEMERHIVTRRWTRPVLVAICLLMVSSGFWLRAVEVIRTHGSIEVTQNYELYRAQRLTGNSAPFAPNTVVSGDKAFVDFAVIAERVRPLRHYIANHTPSVTDTELDQRWALNAYLLGQTREEYETQERAFFINEPFGPISRDRTKLEPRLALQMNTYDSIAADPSPALNQFQVRYLALPAGQLPPAYLSAGGWTQIETGPNWRIWERRVP
jgi:hypothetical protein